ncbi:hypothetical protein [Arenicella chitinivorans]|uniref:hypothetical protein n=1 Tax=Arenicella chitinivorans TaxID=1329800 RepID=UPI00167311E6|nr:hypothetical protein [Arenicella chitinivorans]
MIHSDAWFSGLGSFIWSAQQTKSNTSEAWAMNNSGGGVYARPKTSNADVRCVY